ncbi:MAG: hypothetical protein K5768_09565 [Firmicutes bacterium]|nr:hypothetical protein [Bacillota bacterium]
MNFEKTAKSFEKHFTNKCEKICFAGMPLTILKGKNLCLCASLSIGGCAAVASRKDGRFNARFDDNEKYIMSNVAELEYHKDEPMLEFFTRPKRLGAQLCGADIVLEYNTKIYNEYESLLLSAMYTFCNRMPKIEETKSCLTNAKRDFVSMVGRKDTVLLHGDGEYTYIKFPDNAVKIVICSIQGENYIKETDIMTLENAAKSLALGDYITFGEIITHEHRCSIKEGKIGKASKDVFELAEKLNDALGYGFWENGGIFAIVINSRVNAFVQNLKREYETYYGAAPDFYITRTENSGINAVVCKKDL